MHMTRPSYHIHTHTHTHTHLVGQGGNYLHPYSECKANDASGKRKCLHHGTTVVHMQGSTGVEILGHDLVDQDDNLIRFL
jgi:hypothetical protein